MVDRLARDLKAAYPGASGFSAANLWGMRRVHEAYMAPELLAQAVRKMPALPKAVAARREKLAPLVREIVTAVPGGHSDANVLGGVVRRTFPRFARTHGRPFRLKLDSRWPRTARTKTTSMSLT